MENKTIRHSLWLVQTLLNYKKLSLSELNRLWCADVALSGGQELGRIKLQRMIASVQNILGIVIECERRGGYRYFIATNANVKAAEWLISSYAVNETTTESAQIRDRVLLEDIPSGQFHLSTIVSAMHKGKAIEMDYRKFADSESSTCYIEPYCVKVSQQRWYLLARKDHRDYLQVFALDRIHQLRIIEDSTFVLPENFSGTKFFEPYFGVHTGSNMTPTRILLRVDAFWCNYLRTLPLHASQREVSIDDGGMLFELQMAVTPDFINHLLTFGPDLEVLEPRFLRDQMRDLVLRMAEIYRE